MKTDIILKDRQDGGKDVVVQGQFSLGRLYVKEPDKLNVIMTVSVSNVKAALREVLRKDVPDLEKGDWDSTLNEYINLCILERLGVASHPIIQAEDGTLEGFKDGYNIINHSPLGGS